jgi:hypothetical protein
MAGVFEIFSDVNREECSELGKYCFLILCAQSIRLNHLFAISIIALPSNK